MPALRIGHASEQEVEEVKIVEILYQRLGCSIES
jgi:hypothetical protein